MAKITLDTVAGGYDLSVINNNFDRIEAEFQDKVLYRNNTSGESNTLETDLDANGKRIYNLPQPTLLSQAVRLQDIQDITGGIANLLQFTPYKNISSVNIQSAIQEEIDDLEASNGSSLIGFIQTGSNAVSRSVLSRLRDVVSIKDFGAVGDGVTDDSVAIQNALNSGALAIYVPAGSFLCGNLTIPNTAYLTFFGDGMSSTLVQKAGTGRLIGWDTSSIHYTEGLIAGLRLKGTNGSGHLIDTSGVGGITIRDIFIHDVPVGSYSGIYVNGAVATYTHDIRLHNIQVYSNTVSHSAVRFGGLCSDSSLTDFIVNGNFALQYSMYFDIGATTVRVVDAHPYNNSINVMFMAGSNDNCAFNSVVFDNANSDLVYIQNTAYCTFTDCWFEAIKSGFRGLSVANSSGHSIVNCRFTGSVGADCAFGEDASSNYNRIIGGNCGVIGNFVTPFRFFGAQSYATAINGYDSLGMRYTFSGITATAQAQATTRYLGVNGAQTSAGNTAYLVPESGEIRTVRIAVDSTPAAGQTFTFTVKKNGSTIGSSLVINNGQFGGAITLNASVAQGDQIYIESVFSATSGSANVRYSAVFTA